MARLLRSTPWVEPVLEYADCVIPIPLHPDKLALRGYNQSLQIAQYLVHKSSHKVRKDLLIRIKNTAAQAQLPRHERLQNLAQAFAIEPLKRQEIHLQRIVLVDDVMTSGATLQSAAHCLLQAGAQTVCAIVFARTPHR